MTKPRKIRAADKKPLFSAKRVLIGLLIFIGALITAAVGISNIQTNRAALTISHMGFERGGPTADGPNLIVFTLKNSGPQNAEIKVLAVHAESSIPQSPKYTSKDPPNAIVPAGGTLRVPIDPADPPGSGMPQVLAGSEKLYVFGFIKYSDDFWPLGNMEIGFCYMFDPQRTRVNNFGICPQKKYTYTKRYWAGLAGNRAVTGSDDTSAPFPISRPATPDSITLTP